jgi:ubiquinone/menaquinone biosynthesis C-methylase UbiE
LGQSDNKRLLEIGGGTGWQAKFLSQRGFEVESIDVTSNETKVWPVRVYDGFHIPFDDNHFDLVFSSNVLEHIPHIVDFQKEIQRVLKRDGMALHLVPSSSWRFWSNLTEIIKRWRPPLRHGEHAHNALTEIFYFNKCWWKNLFKKSGWQIIKASTNRIFYTGSSLLDSKLSIRYRTLLSRLLGSSCNVFLLKNVK